MTESYESLWAEITRCDLCKNDERIRQNIRDDWASSAFVPLPGIGPEPSGLPVAYLLVAQEPSASWAGNSLEKAQKKIAGGFKNFSTGGGCLAIRWAAHNWLVNKGAEAFLLTDLAKCAVAGKDVKETMPRRYRNCLPFLNREVKMFLPTLRAIVPVGKEPYRWCIAAAEPEWPPVTEPVTHYASRKLPNVDSEKPLTEAEFADFAKFVEQHDPSCHLHERERKLLGIYKRQFAHIKGLKRGTPITAAESRPSFWDFSGS